jgi:glycosyltransferase involved in cell wall biosynthesis
METTLIAGGSVHLPGGVRVSRRRTVVLASGSPLERKTSFVRQLSLLSCHWKRSGRAALLAGPLEREQRAGALSFEKSCWRLEGRRHEPADIQELIETSGAEALIMLGHPDQFPFLIGGHPPRIPCFLWAQFSRPPDPRCFGDACPVPLTPQTGLFLRRAGCRGVVPPIPHGVDTSAFHPFQALKRQRLRKRRGLGGSFVIGAVGANSRRKRFDLLIRSFSLFARHRANARLLIKTDRPVSLDGIDLSALIDAERLAGRVSLVIEERSEAQMAALYNLMDLYLNLSEWEGFCIPVVEAMACGVPVVTHPIQGPGEILPYRESLVPGSRPRKEGSSLLLEADPLEAAGTLWSLAEQPELRERLGFRGREEAASRYDVRLVAAKWETLLHRRIPGAAGSSTGRSAGTC